MAHIHPFPARMAPEIILTRLSDLRSAQTVLDPMSGSGMVLSVAARKNLKAVGIDLDPLANLISRVGATRIVEKSVILGLENLLEISKKTCNRSLYLPWIDNDLETQNFISYWFADKQIHQLRTLAHHLISIPLIKDKKVRNVLKVTLSRLIISKDPKASLARDTAHSRPHRTITENDFNIFDALPTSLEHVLCALASSEIKADAKTYLGDARNLHRVKDRTMDAIVTSPPYLNAIDYMRGHKFSLVWLGYRISDLRKIRSTVIGTECCRSPCINKEFKRLSHTLNLEAIESKHIRMLEKYFSDLCLQLSETGRVLKKGATASYVIGNSTFSGHTIQNNEILKRAANLAGLELISESTREIPSNRRYLPMNVHPENSLSKRMRTEHIVTFMKPS